MIKALAPFSARFAIYVALLIRQLKMPVGFIYFIFLIKLIAI